MFCRLESFVRGIFAKTFYRFEETLIQRADCSRILKKEKKKQMFEATENKSRWLFLKNNLVLKNNVESVRSNLNEL